LLRPYSIRAFSMDLQQFKAFVDNEENENIDEEEVKTQGAQNKVTPKLLCRIIGAKYYLHNEEIQLNEN
jgi:hypothetical protein